jgi:hypothetical protein
MPLHVLKRLKSDKLRVQDHLHDTAVDSHRLASGYAQGDERAPRQQQAGEETECPVWIATTP